MKKEASLKRFVKQVVLRENQLNCCYKRDQNRHVQRVANNNSGTKIL